MKKSLPPHDPIETMGEAYELLLEKALQKAHQSGTAVHQMLDAIRGDIAALTKFSDDEVVKLEEYVKRDLIDAARYLDKTGKELKDWVGFDVALMKQDFWERFSEAADQTTTALYQLKQQAASAEYHSGELTGLGMLVCDQCGEKLHFHKPGHIPPCPKCNSTRFHRQGFE
ncbi:MAG TPA: zinc ribbon-containing protein [Sulfuricella sp.]|nr:zinc ribbon-containing protein [Sulfuricella sp.]